ncbi:MAG: hypothetical protein LUG52_06680 [Clostridia bacterium]|nr:hypothetical protein [Clostridia bacterium]
MGKIGEWREILRNAAQRAAFWARMSRSEVREDGEGRSAAVGSGESGEERIERESGEGLRDKKELWVEKEAERNEREERAAALSESEERAEMRDNDAQFYAEKRERERSAVRERVEKEAEIGEGYAAEGAALLAVNAEAEKFAEAAGRISEGGEKIAGRMTAGIMSEKEVFSESGERRASRAAAEVMGAEGAAQFYEEEKAFAFARMSGADGAEDLTEEIVGGGISAEEILRGAAIDADIRRFSYGGSAEMKREMLKMKISEAKGGGEVKIEMVNNNQFKSEVDMDEIADRLTERIADLMARSADGVYL